MFSLLVWLTLARLRTRRIADAVGDAPVGTCDYLSAQTRHDGTTDRRNAGPLGAPGVCSGAACLKAAALRPAQLSYAGRWPRRWG